MKVKPLVITPTHDTPFKFTFGEQGESEELLTAFLNQLLDLKGQRKIVELKFENVELSPQRADGRRLLLDLRVQDLQGITYNLEVQRQNTASMLKRALFQQSRITGDQLNKSSHFDELRPVVIVLLCDYSTYPDDEQIRVFQLAPYSLQERKSQKSLPCRVEHFDPEQAPRYTQLKKRLEQADEALEHLQIYLVELDKQALNLTFDQSAWLHYLTSEITIHQRGDQAMNQQNSTTPKYMIPENASPEARKWIEKAQARLDHFAALPDQRRAYEYELLERLQHNTLLHNSRKEGVEEGFEEGLEKGREEGLEKGREEGLEKGREEGLEKGREEGLEKGREEGLEKGREEGLEKGLEKGREEERARLLNQSIPKLQSAGFTAEQIAETLGMTAQEVEQWFTAKKQAES